MLDGKTNLFFSFPPGGLYIPAPALGGLCFLVSRFFCLDYRLSGSCSGCAKTKTHVDGRSKRCDDWPMETHFSHCTLGCSLYISILLCTCLGPGLFYKASNTIFSISSTSARFSPRLLACFAVTMSLTFTDQNQAPLCGMSFSQRPCPSITRRFLPTSFGIAFLTTLEALYSFCLYRSTILQ